MSNRGIVRCREAAQYLLRDGVADSLDEIAELVAHGLGRDTGGGGLEVELALTAQTGRVATWHEGVHAAREKKEEKAGGQYAAVTLCPRRARRRRRGLTWQTGG